MVMMMVMVEAASRHAAPMVIDWLAAVVATPFHVPHPLGVAYGCFRVSVLHREQELELEQALVKVLALKLVLHLGMVTVLELEQALVLELVWLRACDKLMH